MHHLYRLALACGVIAGVAGLFAGTWIAATGSFRMPLWGNALAATGTVLVASLLETAVEARQRPRSVPARHRKDLPR